MPYNITVEQNHFADKNSGVVLNANFMIRTFKYYLFGILDLHLKSYHPTNIILSYFRQIETHSPVR